MFYLLRMIKCLPFLMLVVFIKESGAQVKRINYNPCFLMDSVDRLLDFIQRNATRIFADTNDCRQALLDSVAAKYITTNKIKYLDALTNIRQNPGAKVEDLYTDIIKRLIENNFEGLINQFYLGRGKYLPLEREMIGTMNMIVDGRPFKQKYMGLLNVEIERAKDKKDRYKQVYLEKLKVKIEEEKMH